MKKHLLLILMIFLFHFFYAQNFEWAKQFKGSGSYDMSYINSVDNQGNVYSLGSYNGVTDFDPGINTYTLSGTGISLTKLDADGNFIWAKKMGGSISNGGYDMVIGPSGNLIIISYLNGTMDFDPGVGVFNLTGSGNLAVTKLNPQGNFIWAKSIGQGLLVNATAIVVDSLSNIYTIGRFQGAGDFDPSTSTYNLSSIGYYDIFVNKLDSSGNFLWVKQIAGSSDETATDITIDKKSNIYITGYFSGNTDFDPSINTYTFNSANAGYICKLDSSGSFIWAKQFNSITDYCYPLSITIDAKANVYTTGLFKGICDFDPSLAAYTLTNTSGYNEDSFINRLDSSGNFIWCKQVEGWSNDRGVSIAVDQLKYVYLTGFYSSNTDFDPGLGIYNLTSTGGSDGYILKLDSLGNFVWVNDIGTDNLWPSIVLDPAGNIYHAGTFYGNMDFDPSTGTYTLSSFGGNSDLYLAKLSQGICSNLTLIVDSISNLTCNNISTGYCSTHGANGFAPYYFSWNTSPINYSPIVTFTTAGIYTIMMRDSNNCTRSRSFLINNNAAPTGFDLNTNLITNSFRSGFNSHIWLDAFNDGCSLTNGQLKLVLDNKINFISSLPAPTNYSGDTLMWNFNLINFDSLHIKPVISIKTPSTTIIGDTVCLQSIIIPVNSDFNSSNNIKTFCFLVKNGYDPNDKQVYPKGICTPGYILNNQLLTYTIRFQNVGTASAINIIVMDSLNANLDLNSVRVIGSSHTMYTEVLPNNILKFHFDNINLADSTNNEIGSHGYVIFEVLPLPNLPIGTLITNKADIYFDFNVPVTTNKEINTIINVLPSYCGIATDIRSFENSNINLYPNPNTGRFAIVLNNIQSHFDIEIIDMLGQLVKTVSASNTDKINLELENPAGIYFAKIITGNNQYIIKLLKQ